MALVVRFNLVIVRKTSIAAKYRGGLDAFRAEWAKARGRGYACREDDHLVGFCFMGPYETPLLQELEAAGLVYRFGEPSQDVTFGNQANGIEPGCGWLAQGMECGLPVCWLRGAEPGQIIDFDG